jgi:DNA-binding MarR family transcriptional regulator
VYSGKEGNGQTYRTTILLTLRQIIHAVDAYSRKLAANYRVTGPQLICLHSIVEQEPVSQTELARRVSLSPGTVNGILDRLENREWIRRERDECDRRRVLLRATEAGRELIDEAPPPLQDILAGAIKDLPENEQEAIAKSLQRVAQLMELSAIQEEPKTVKGKGGTN